MRARATATMTLLLLTRGEAGRAAGTTDAATTAAPTPPTEVVVIGPPRTDRGTVVSFVGEKDIERFGASSVGETLERLPSISSGGGARGERILALRGFHQRQLAVFVDGVPVYVPYDGQLDLSKLPVDMISRITVVNGSGSLLYGPNGLGGAINVATREPAEAPSLRLRTEAAPWSATRASVVGSAALGPVKGMMGAALESVLHSPLSGDFRARPNQTPGRRRNSDRRSASLASKWTLGLSEAHRLTLSASRVGGMFGVPPATRDLTVRYWRWTDWESASIGLSHAYRGARFQSEEIVYASRFANTLDSYDDGRYATQRLPKAFENVYDDSSLGAFVRTTNIVALGPSRAVYLRTWSGFKHDRHSSVDAPDPRITTVSTNILTTSVAADADVLAPWVRAGAGLQLDGELPDRPPSGPRPSASAALGPLASITVAPARAWTVVLSAASRTRFPTLRERFSTVFGARDPSPLLAPEHAWNFSVDGVLRPARALRLVAGLFDSELTDLITSAAPRPESDQLRNVGRARNIGAEAELEWSTASWFELRAGWTVMRARGGAALDERIAYRPAEKGLVAATVLLGRAVSVTAVMRHVGEQDFQNPDTGAWGRLGGHQLFDARAEWRVLPVLRAWVRASNLTDANVEGRYSFPEPGRTVFVGVGSEVGS